MTDVTNKTLSDVNPDSDAEKRENVQLVSFVLGEEFFGVNILLVQEIITVPEITRIPNSPSFIEGMINLRGRLLPVVDLRKRLYVGKEFFDRKTRILVIQIEDKITGFLVDSVEAVMSVPADSIEAAPEIVTIGIETQYITGISKLDDRMIILLDFKRLFNKEEMTSLDHIKKNLGDKEDTPEA
ncbi:MAG: chemotaxis protein CheW [Deltaproteobacteria bacterium]|nr:chemotaxis protein CheW [Deltaproteobacteria bacterium]